MALAGYPFPYDINNLLGGACRVLYGDPADVDIPVDPSDVIDLIYPYAAQDGWTDLGATRDAFSYTRGFDTEGQEIQQVAGNVLEEITSISRGLSVSMAEFNAEGFALMEGAPGVDTVAAVAGAHPGFDTVSFGSFSSLTRYRVAFVSQRSKASGSVTEPVADGAKVRGRFVMGWANQAQLSADEITLELDKGALSAVALGFTLFPDGDVADAETAWGGWGIEAAGTIGALPG